MDYSLFEEYSDYLGFEPLVILRFFFFFFQSLVVNLSPRFEICIG